MPELDFSKIFGETATSKASFTDENYINGWGYLGSTPPPYQLFDYLQSLNDKKSKYLYERFNNYLPLTGGTVTGTLDVPTQSTTDNSTKVANTAFVQSAVSQLVNSAPETLDTLNELSNALGDDPNFATTVANMIGQKADKTVVDNIVNVMYPVGIIVEFAEDVDPNTTWVGTTWERMKNGRVLVSAGQYNETNWEHLYALGETGGEALHTLTTEEMPSHSHSGSTSTNGDHSHTVTTFNVFGKIDGNTYNDYCKGSTNRTTSTNGNHQHSLNIDNTGGGSAHNNMQPYEVVNRWKRIA